MTSATAATRLWQATTILEDLDRITMWKYYTDPVHVDRWIMWIDGSKYYTHTPYCRSTHNLVIKKPIFGCLVNHSHRTFSIQPLFFSLVTTDPIWLLVDSFK